MLVVFVAILYIMLYLDPNGRCNLCICFGNKINNIVCVPFQNADIRACHQLGHIVIDSLKYINMIGCNLRVDQAKSNRDTGIVMLTVIQTDAYLVFLSHHEDNNKGVQLGYVVDVRNRRIVKNVRVAVPTASKKLYSLD